ncbi:MAG: hypothetical protein AB7I04_13070 [Pseudomonadales bacterium]
METTIWIAGLIGPVILALSIPMITAPEKLQETTVRFLADPPLVLVSGVLAMTAGLSIVNTHNLWVLDWPVIVTVFGWALTLGGVTRVAFPQVVDRVGASMMNQRVLTRVMGVVWLLIGAFLTWKAYL